MVSVYQLVQSSRISLLSLHRKRAWEAVFLTCPSVLPLNFQSQIGIICSHAPDTSATWGEKIPWLRAQTDLEIWVKGGKLNT